jgi:hypothetical protein
MEGEYIDMLKLEIAKFKEMQKPGKGSGFAFLF